MCLRGKIWRQEATLGANPASGALKCGKGGRGWRHSHGSPPLRALLQRNMGATVSRLECTPADSQQGTEPRLASTLARERRSAQGVVTTWGLFLRQDLAVWSRLASNPCSPSLHLYSTGTQVKVSFSPVSRREGYSLHFGSGKASAGIPSTEL